MGIKKQIEKLREYKSSVQSYVMQGKEDLQKSNEHLDRAVQKAQKTQEDLSKTVSEEKNSLEKTINTSYDARSKLSATVDDAKTTQEQLAELSEIVSKIENKYITEITALKNENKELLQKEYSLESVTQQITKDLEQYKKEALKEAAVCLEELGVISMGISASRYNENYLRMNNKQSVITAVTKIGEIQIKTYNKEDVRTHLEKEGPVKTSYKTKFFADYSDNAGMNEVFAIEIKKNGSSSANEVVDSKEFKSLVDLKFFDLLLTTYSPQEAKEHALQKITPETESAYAATIQKYLTNEKVHENKKLSIKETFKDFVPKYE